MLTEHEIQMLERAATVSRDGPDLHTAGHGAIIRGAARVASGGRLTRRQLEVLRLLCEGLSNKLICRNLDIAEGTVKGHIACILKTLGVATRLQAVVEARRRRLVPDEAGE